jgi:hypothetical protein
MTLAGWNCPESQMPLSKRPQPILQQTLEAFSIVSRLLRLPAGRLCLRRARAMEVPILGASLTLTRPTNTSCFVLKPLFPTASTSTVTQIPIFHEATHPASTMTLMTRMPAKETFLSPVLGTSYCLAHLKRQWPFQCSSEAAVQHTRPPPARRGLGNLLEEMVLRPSVFFFPIDNPSVNLRDQDW